ncbi:uncharacterized protein G2W53_033410 [Senna tora]|uniref:Uncharacterized protein n=1 Tax=Senna tora TaxID=362788 RepID=A0A834WCT3_9FABA|nr:uncharacterized protein G2W53_033410 [Senna tora]
MTSQTFLVITSPIRALNPLEFPNIMRTDRFDSLVPQQELDSTIKSTQIPKCNAKRSI